MGNGRGGGGGGGRGGRGGTGERGGEKGGEEGEEEREGAASLKSNNPGKDTYIHMQILIHAVRYALLYIEYILQIVHSE